jgi:hypothetical protein
MLCFIGSQNQSGELAKLMLAYSLLCVNNTGFPTAVSMAAISSLMYYHPVVLSINKQRSVRGAAVFGYVTGIVHLVSAACYDTDVCPFSLPLNKNHIHSSNGRTLVILILHVNHRVCYHHQVLVYLSPQLCITFGCCL